MLILMSMATTAAWSLIYWTNTIYGAQLGLVFYGFSQNYEVVYFAYIYAIVSKDHFSAVSSFTHAALLAGRFINILFTIYLLPYISWSFKFLHYATIAIQAVATSFVLKLPASSSAQIDAGSHNSQSNKFGQRMLEKLKFAYTNERVIFWSIWYICGTAIFNQITMLLTSLSKLLPENEYFVSQSFYRRMSLFSKDFLLFAVK